MISKPQKTGVIGHPISHSKSPLIHNLWLKEHGIAATYEAIDIAPENLEADIKAMIDDGFIGFNVTIPHKEAVYALCDETDHAADACGAVNTVVIKDGKLIGANTDPFGFLNNLMQHVPDFDFEESPAVVIGAGGAARAIVSGLIGKRAPEVIITNRTREKAEKIAEEIGLGTDLVEVVDWEERHDALQWAGLLINASSLGMKGQPALDLNLENLADYALVSDIVYTPLETELLKAAKARGNPTVTGIGMLLHQARPAFQLWFGMMPEVNADLEKLVLE